MTAKTATIVALFLGLQFTGSVWADSYYIEKATGIGVADSDLAATTEMVRQGVIAMGSEKVSNSAAEADFTLRPKLTKLGATYVVSLEKLKAGSVVFGSRMKAASLEEMDTVASRLARSVVKSIEVDQDARITDVTKSEATRGEQRKQAHKGYLLGFGPSSLSNVNSDGVAYGFSGAYAWDVNEVLVKVYADISSRAGSSFMILGLGGNYYFSDRDSSPYVTAGFGYASAMTPLNSFLPDTKGGFGLTAGGGVMFMRTTSVHVELGGVYSVLLGSTALGTPMCFGLRLSLFFPG